MLCFKEHLFFKGLCVSIWGKKINEICFIQISYSRGADCLRIYSGELPKRKMGGRIIGIYHTC